MDAMEKAINMEREERRQDQEKLKELVEQEKIVILWEICDRLAQGMCSFKFLPVIPSSFIMADHF